MNQILLQMIADVILTHLNILKRISEAHYLQHFKILREYCHSIQWQTR